MPLRGDGGGAAPRGRAGPGAAPRLRALPRGRRSGREAERGRAALWGGWPGPGSGRRGGGLSVPLVEKWFTWSPVGMVS